LKTAISAFDGTVIVVSHDREFLDGLVTKVYEFGNQKVLEHLGGIYDFLQNKKIENLKELERKNTPQATQNSSKPITDNKQDYAARKEFSRQLKKMERQLEETEANIDRIEKEITLLEISMSSENSPAAYTEYEQLKQKLAVEMERWEELSLEKEQLQNT